MTAESLSRLLGHSAEIRPLAQQIERIQRLQDRYRTLVPQELAQASRVCAIEGTTVVVCATSGPIAAALKQLAPRLLQGLREPARKSLKQHENQELTGIRIEVQVAVPVRRRATPARGKLPMEQLAKLAAGLPDSPLKQTLDRITRPAQNRRTREKT